MLSNKYNGERTLKYSTLLLLVLYYDFMNLFKLLITPLVNTPRQQESIDFTEKVPKEPPVLYTHDHQHGQTTNIVPIDPQPRIRRNRTSNIWLPHLSWTSSSKRTTKSAVSIKQIHPENAPKQIDTPTSSALALGGAPVTDFHDAPLRGADSNLHWYNNAIQNLQVETYENTPDNGTIIPSSQYTHPYYILEQTLLNEHDVDNYDFYCLNVSENLLPFIKTHNKIVDTLEMTSNYIDIKNHTSSFKSISCPDFLKHTWNPPNTHGLQNCEKIIPNYYFQTNFTLKRGPILDIDYLWIIKDDIRNMRKLNDHQIQYIKTLDEDEKNEIIKEFNSSRNMMIEVINMRSLQQSRNTSTKVLLEMATAELDSRRNFAEEEKVPSQNTPMWNIRANMPRTSTL